MGVVWVWHGPGLGVAWAWSGCGMDAVWVWHGRGLGVAWAWSGCGMGMPTRSTHFCRVLREVCLYTAGYGVHVLRLQAVGTMDWTMWK